MAVSGGRGIYEQEGGQKVQGQGLGLIRAWKEHKPARGTHSLQRPEDERSESTCSRNSRQVDD